MHIRQYIQIMTVLLLALALAGCGASGAEQEREREARPQTTASTQTTADPAALQSIVGRPLSATQTELVLATADGERTFQIEPQDLPAVDPGHVGSHVNVEGIAFRVTYREVDGVEYATAAEEVAAQGAPVA